MIMLSGMGYLLLASIALEMLCLWGLHRYKRVLLFLGVLTVFTTALAAGGLLVLWPSLASAFVLFVCAYRTINLLRLFEMRTPPKQLIPRLKLTALWLYLDLALIALGCLAWRTLSPGMRGSLFFVLPIVLLVVALAALLHTYTRLRALKSLKASTKEAKIPAISVCIPARNETTELTDCLSNVLASTYPKLDVLVLDDCSQAKTATIIKGFAHDGVRFVAGEPAPKGWLSKNYALEQLVAPASGQYLVCMGVDIRLDASALTNIMHYMAEHKLDMVSVIPSSNPKVGLDNLVRSLRYWWGLVLPSKVLSSDRLWIINRDVLKKLGGLRAVQNSVHPEAFFAKALQKKGTYQLLLAGNFFTAHSLHMPQEEYQRALRNKYSHARRRPERVLLFSALEALCLIFPLLAMVFSLSAGFTLYAVLYGASLLCWIIIDGLILKARSNPLWWLLPWTLPIVGLLELYLNNKSMLTYEFGTVEWKGRNICLPVLQQIPKLPQID